ncbi:hypothetical protein [Streptomyces nogalater]|uniref:Uncharacterized protein n=1 Tax=Streptomyces nogalater TaxID=38314 RepID=A0ABW0W9Q3_STRNO
MTTHRILFQAPATATRDVDLPHGLTDRAAIQEAAEDQGIDFPTVCNGCETHIDLSDDWKPVAIDGTPLPSPDDEATVEALSDTIEQFFNEVDIETFESDDLATAILRTLKCAGLTN